MKIELYQVIASPKGVFQIGQHVVEEDFGQTLIAANVAKEIKEHEPEVVIPEVQPVEVEPIETRVQKPRNRATTPRAK